MPNENRIDQFTTIFQELSNSINKGSARVVPNNEIIDDTPSDLPAGYIRVKDELGYYIPAVTVANLVVETGQFVNLLYVEGTEPIAFQQGSSGTANIALWQLVGGTGPDIYYNNGNVSIGKTTSPDATLEILDTTVQLRLTHTDASKYADFAVDTGHNLTITPSDTGQIIFKPTVNSIDFFEIQTAAGTPLLIVSTTNRQLLIGTGIPVSTLTVRRATSVLATIENTIASASNQGAFIILASNDGAAQADGDRLGGFAFRGQTDPSINHNSVAVNGFADGAWSVGDAPGRIEFQTTPAGSISRITRMTIKNDGNVGIGTQVPAAKLVVFDSGVPIPAIFLNDGDISTPFTTIGTPNNDANTIGRIGGASSADGGLVVSGFTDPTAGAASIGLWFEGYLGAASPIAPAITINAYKTNGGTGAGAIAASEMALQITNAFSTKLATVLGNGDFGIQNISPTTPLSTGFSNIGLTIGDGSATAGIVLYSATNSTLSSLRFGDGGGGVYDQGFVIYDHNNDKLSLGANRGTALTIDSSQNIGINGITLPSAELDIGAGAMEYAEMTAPGSGAVNTARVYAVDNGAGKTQLAVVFNTGAVQILATEP